MSRLLAERQLLIHEKDNLVNDDENEKRIVLNFINTKLQQLYKRITEARAVDLTKQTEDEIRFCTMVTLMT